MGSFRFDGQRIAYREHGSGDRVLVLVHGLLMNHRMYDRLAPAIAARGNRVVCVDLLGHGASDRPDDLRRYSISAFADQVDSLLDHLEIAEAVVGGTSLGANVGLELAARHPARARGLMVEMPVLENALVAVAMIFTPIIVALRFGAPAIKAVAAATGRVPRTHYLVDIVLDWLRREPEPSLAVLQGMLLGRTCPPRAERRALEQPALVIGHRADPLHPFTDADMLVEEMPNSRLVNANSIVEWRLSPERLNDELAAFLDEVWSAPGAGSSEAPPKRATA